MSIKTLGPDTFLITGAVADYARQQRRFWSQEAMLDRKEKNLRVALNYRIQKRPNDN